MTDSLRPLFWQKPLSSLNSREWEALCDGCGQCCQVKLEDEDSRELAITDMVCQYLDTQHCRCTVYPRRFEAVPDCTGVTEQIAREARWLPETCAYRRRAAGQPLPDWHPLLTGDPQSVHRADISVAGRVVSEAEVDDADWEEHIIHWVD